MRYKVLKNDSQKEVYESNCLEHAKIYINSCPEPWEYHIIEKINVSEDKFLADHREEINMEFFRRDLTADEATIFEDGIKFALNRINLKVE